MVNMFRLVREHPNVPGTDTIKVNIKEQYKWHERTVVIDYSLAVAMIVETESSISEDPFAINDSTDSQTTVLKTLHENNKGVFYMGKTGKGHLAKKSRIFLTPEEVEMMRKYHTEAKTRLENKIIVR